MSILPVAYSITHEGLRLDIALVETKNLYIHEETIPARLENLKRRIERDGIQSAPILVDRNNLVVLDGMHRTAVMTHLNCRFTCVCLLDYFDPSINVQRWCRVIPGPFSEKNAKEFLDSVGLTMEPFEIVESPDEDRGLLIVFRNTAYKLVSDSNDLVDLFKRSYQLELNLEEYGYEIKHCTESQAVDLMSSGYEATLYIPKVEKQEVVDIATNNQVFTPKATRHRLPARPLSVDVPLSLLRNTEISLEEANTQLAEHLNKKTLTRHDHGAEWMGRIYDEVLYIFSDL
jgi:L-serine kinase (ADP)